MKAEEEKAKKGKRVVRTKVFLPNKRVFTIVMFSPTRGCLR